MNKVIYCVFNINIRRIIKTLLKILRVFPIKQNRIIFESFEKAIGYNDNPKYISDYLKKYYPGRFEIVWSIDDIKKITDSEIKTLKYGTIKYYYYIATSKVLIFNVRNSPLLSKRKEQMVINTWHAGGAYKRTGVKHIGYEKFEEWCERQVRDFTDYFLSSSDMFTKYNILEGMNYTGKILNTGMPRNDFLMDTELYNDIRSKVRNSLNIENHFVILYAPTFRGKGDDILKVNTFPPFDEIINSIKMRFNKDAIVLFRTHHKDHNAYNKSSFVDVSEYHDMQELICASDMLITDYSSSIWDYSLTQKPCILYVPDIAYYEKKDRGFFIPIRKWPGLMCKNEEEIICSIRNLDLELCKKIADKHQNEMGSYERGSACSEVADLIMDFTLNGTNNTF